MLSRQRATPTGAESFTQVPSSPLPIFRRGQAGYTVFYAPGRVVVVDRDDADAFEESLANPADPDARMLTAHARAALEARTVSREAPFEPVCLTLYLGNQCNLKCTYCFAGPSREPAPQLDWPEIHAAGREVIGHCRDRGVAFVTVLHGGCEPGMFPELVDTALDGLHRLAEEHRVPMVSHIATNGVLTASRARWLARRVDGVGLSCDGPEPRQSSQRPTWSGRSTSAQVERTAAIVRSEGTRLDVRVTITPDSLGEQAEIARYVCERLQPTAIHLEPVYRGGRGAAFDPEDAPTFVAGFLAAKAVAATYGVPVSMSGTRPSERHGPYCNTDRDVLQLVPGGVVSACFKAHNAAEAAHSGTGIGSSGPTGLVWRPQRIAELRSELTAWPEGCHDCFNRFHCTLGCPDACPLDGDRAPAGFRCAVAKELASYLVDESAARLWRERGGARIAAGAVAPP